MGIMNRIPSVPPVKAIAVTVQKWKSVQYSISTSAGMVKMMPAASDSPAEAQVCTWFASRIDRLRKIVRNASIATAAAGIEADTVMPTLRPT